MTSANRKLAKQATREARENMRLRSCGTCNACCTTQGVGELAKPAGMRCEHLFEGSGKGCSIYARRPSSCSEWSCIWRSGGFDGVDRPDRVGVVMDVTDKDFTLYPDGQALVAREVFPGGLDKAQSFLSVQAQKTVVILVSSDRTRHVIEPPDKVERVRAAMSRFLPVVQ